MVFYNNKIPFNSASDHFLRPLLITRGQFLREGFKHQKNVGLHFKHFLSSGVKLHWAK